MSQPPRAPGGADGGLAAALAIVEQLQPALQRGERGSIVELVRQLVALRAPMGSQWQALAQVAADNGEIGLARAAIDLFARSAGGGPEASYQKAGLLAYLGAWGEAHALLKSVPPHVPDPGSHAYSRGTAALYLGEIDDARRHLETATTLRRDLGSPWLSLAALVDFAQEPELADRLIAAEQGLQNAVPGERAVYYYALGKAHADRSDRARAFAAFVRGAGEMRARLPYSRERDRGLATDAVSGYEPERIAAVARQQSEHTDRTIFVTGLPRSGTTLVEQILTSHSAVSEGAETGRLGLLVKEIDGVAYPSLRRYVDTTGAPAAARLWRHWMNERFPAPGRVVDKTVTTTRMLGIAAALLPDAPLIWLTRDPLDCAWSCFRTYFNASMPWSNDLEDIAFHFRLEDELLSRWQEILGERLLVVPYEELVTAPERWIRRLLSHCGLAEEPAVFAPHENARQVTTSSVMQVRRPIYQTGIGSAEPYLEFLAPFLDAYHR